MTQTNDNAVSERARKPLFKVGDLVQRAKPRSYLFPGIVIGANLKLDGATWLYSVECVAPGVQGMVHEFTERALETRTPTASAGEGLALLRDIADEVRDPDGAGTLPLDLMERIDAALSSAASADVVRLQIKDIINAHVRDCFQAAGVVAFIPRHPGPAADAIIAALRSTP